MVGIVLAAGNGSRLKSSTKENICKPLTPIGGVMLISYCLENLVQLGLDRVYIVVGKEGEQIQSRIGSRYKGLQVRYVEQSQPKGLIHALMQAVDVLEQDQTVVLQLSDEIFLNFRASRILQAVERFDFICGVTPEENPEKIKGNYCVEVDGDGLLRKCTEKPAVVSNDMKGTGFCVFRPGALEILRQHYHRQDNSPRELCDYMNLLIRENQRGLALQIADREFNINALADITEAENALQSVKSEGSDGLKILVSACLLGEKCKYNGGDNYSPAVIEYVKDHPVIPVCPEMRSGMGCPRIPIEIVDGVLMDRNGNNVDKPMRQAIRAILEEIHGQQIGCAILKSRSPTCGVKQVYDGTFSGKLISGSGLFAQALKDAGYRVIDSEEIPE